MISKQIMGAVVAGCLLTSSLVAGDVTGKVIFKGKAPVEPRINMNADPVCRKAHKKPVFGESVVVNKNGTLKNVLVFIKSGLAPKKYPTPTQKLLFDQEGCEYNPHVLGIMVGQELDIKNSDNTLHNVHSLSKLNPQFNRAQPIKNMVMSEKFEKVETFKVKCEVHPWMNAYIGVFDNPYFAVTGDDGSFTLKGVPAGEYTIEAWQEKYGEKTGKVKVDASGKATVDFTYQGG
jgi:plastocyanin